jgi:hypothetical protein
MEQIFILQYIKEFKYDTHRNRRTRHLKASADKDKLLAFCKELCEKYNLVFEKSTKPEHEFLFLDGDFVYYGKSTRLEVEFICCAEKLL